MAKSARLLALQQPVKEANIARFIALCERVWVYGDMGDSAEVHHTGASTHLTSKGQGALP